MTTFNIDDRVILTGALVPMPEYPVWGSAHASVGTVYAIMGDRRVHVKWDNGEHNSFNILNLSMYSTLLSTDPNRSFRISRQFRKMNKNIDR
jgi:hypothetical protein